MPGHTSRLLLPYPLSSESPNGPAEIQALATALDSTVIYGEGILSARPTSTSGSPGIQGRFYYVAGDSTPANNGILWWDTGTSWVAINSGRVPFLHYQDQQTSGTGGPALSATTWTTVPLNTEVSDSQAIGALSAGEVTIPAGTYEVRGGFPLHGQNGGPVAKARLRNITDSITLVVGGQVLAGAGGGAVPGAWIPLDGDFTIGAAKAIALQAYTTVATAIGDAAGSGEVEIYGDLVLKKVA